MAVSVDNRPSRFRSGLAAVLTILILVPAGLLFLIVWQQNEDERDSTKLEQLGIEYMTALFPLVSALAEAQSTALQNLPGPPASLTAAVARVNAVDQRLGETLGTRERWTGLRDKIGRLPSVAGNPIVVFQAHVEVTDLSLALYNAVLDNSQLSRDPDNDIAHLQEALGVDLPSTVIQVSRMGDLSLMLANVSGTPKEQALAQQILAPQFGAAVQAVNTSVSRLTDNLQAAVDDTQSTTLSGSLVTTVDGFRRGVEAFIRGANPGEQQKPNPAGMATAQSQLQTSLSSLSGVLVRETNGLLTDRLDDLDSKRLQALVLIGVAVLLVVAAVIVPLTGRRRATEQPSAGPDNGRGMHVGPGGSDNYGNSHFDPAPAYGDEVHPTRRERSGALR